MKTNIANKVITIGVCIIIILGFIGYGSKTNNVIYKFASVIYNTLNEIRIGKYTGDINTFKSEIEVAANDSAINLLYLNINTYLQKSAGVKVFEDAKNSVTQLNNGYLAFIYNEEQNVEECAQNLIELEKELINNQIKLLYIQAPSKISKYETQLQDGVKDNLNENVDQFINIIQEEVDYIDLREEMYSQGINQYDFFFKTDHHWTPEGTFWSFNRISDRLNEEYNFNILEEHRDINNYNIETYEGYFLGSQGKRIGDLLVEPDDLSVIIPKFNTGYESKIESREIEKNGTFEDVFIFREHIQEELFYSNDYATYTGGDYEYAEYVNTQTTNEQKVLLVRDSYSCTFTPFLSLGVKQLDTIDLRHFKEKSLLEHINENQYDTVIILYNPTMIKEEMFIFE